MPGIGKDSSEDGTIVNPGLSYSADQGVDEVETDQPEDIADEANDLRFIEENELIRQQGSGEDAG